MLRDADDKALGEAAQEGGRGMSEGRLDDLREWLRQQEEPPEPKWPRPVFIALAVAAVLVVVAALLLAL